MEQVYFELLIQAKGTNVVCLETFFFIGSSLGRRVAAATPHWGEQINKTKRQTTTTTTSVLFVSSDRCKINIPPINTIILVIIVTAIVATT